MPVHVLPGEPDIVSELLLADPETERDAVAVPHPVLGNQPHQRTREPGGGGAAGAVRDPRVGPPQLLAQHTDNTERHRSEEHTSELQSLMRISYADFCLKKKNPYRHVT